MTVSLETAEDRKKQEHEAHTKPLPRPPEAYSLAAQWTGLFLAPAVFFVHLQGAYLLVLRACQDNGMAWVHAAGAVAVIVSAVGTFVAWRVWTATGGTSPGESTDTAARARFLGICGLVVSAMITLILVAQLVTGFFTSPCQ